MIPVVKAERVPVVLLPYPPALCRWMLPQQEISTLLSDLKKSSEVHIVQFYLYNMYRGKSFKYETKVLHSKKSSIIWETHLTIQAREFSWLMTEMQCTSVKKLMTIGSTWNFSYTFFNGLLKRVYRYIFNLPTRYHPTYLSHMIQVQILYSFSTFHRTVLFRK